MKRLPMLLLAAAASLPAVAGAQGLTMQMSNGWKFTFSGNVNAFAVYSSDANGGRKNFNIRTGLLPGFAVFDAKGKEEGLDLGIHVGFAPEIQNNGQVHDGLAQIDMRQLYLTVGMKSGWQILAGRELGVFSRQNILNDMTLYGTGAQGGVQGGGTTLGRIGYGYIYPNFNSQISFTSPAGRSWQLTLGAFQPSVRATGFTFVQTPRIEAELTLSPQMSGKSRATVWGGFLWQSTKNAPTGGTSISATGFTAGGRISMGSGVAVTASAYTGTGLGTTFLFQGGQANAANQRKSDGGYAQATYTAGRTTFGASYGISRLKGAGTASSDATTKSIGQVSSWTFGAYHQWTRSLKLVGEITREINDLGGFANPLTGPNRTDVSAGLMLFF